MKDLTVIPLAIPDVKVLRFSRIRDERGFLVETLRQSEFAHERLPFGGDGFPLAQINESVSRARTVRGLHFQSRPYIGKLVRPNSGCLIDLALDIRLGSPTFGSIVGHRLEAVREREYDEWMWLPPGFAHGALLLEDTHMVYLMTGEYEPSGEVAVSIDSPDIEWSLCDAAVAHESRKLIDGPNVMTDRDRNAPPLSEWAQGTHPLAQDFQYGNLPLA